LPKDPGSIHNTHMAADNHLFLKLQGISYPFLASAGSKSVCGTQAYHSYKKKISTKKIDKSLAQGECLSQEYTPGAKSGISVL
jgi:hypothetical protein